MMHNGSKEGKESCEKKVKIFTCEFCDYNTSRNSSWKKHIQTKKHNGAQMVHNTCKSHNREYTSTGGEMWSCVCGKSYKYHQGLYRHRKTCVFNDLKNNNIDSKDLIITSLLEANERMTKSIEHSKIFAEDQVKQLTATVKDMAPRIGHNINHIRFFLNKDCAGAMSIQDFAEKLSVSLHDISLLKDNEPMAITGIIKNNLEHLCSTERPMHTYEKRWYVKDRSNGWEGNGENKIVNEIKNGVSRSGIQFLDAAHPEWKTNEKHAAAYAKTTAALMRDVDIKSKGEILKSIGNSVKWKSK